MRLRSSLTAVGVVSLLTMGALAACGGDDSGNGGNVSDASTGPGADTGIVTDSGKPVDSGPAAPTAEGSDVAVYVGLVAQIDASASTPPSATFAWTVSSVPAGSTIVTGSLQNAATAKPSFTPDLVGDYALKVVVTASGLSANKTITVHAHPGKTFFGHTDALPDGGAISEVRYANTDGTGKSTVSCDTTVRTGQSGGSAGSPYAQSILMNSLDWQEGAPADDPKVVFGFRDVVDDGGFTNYLAVGKGSSTCATLAKVDPIINTGNMPQGARIAPNGDRVAFVRNDGTSVDIATVGLDGANLRILGQMFIGDGGTNAPPTTGFSVRRVQWTDETHVAWIAEQADHTSFSVYLATDSASPGAASIMDCAAGGSISTQPNVSEFAVLPGGNILVDGVIATFDAGTAAQLQLLSPDPTTKQCTLVRSIGNGASDFSISPDGKTLAFVQEDDAGTTQLLFTAPVNGSTDPAAVAFGDAGLAAETLYGPRWVNGGARLVLTDPEILADGGSTTNIVSIAPAGGTRTVVATGTATEGFFSPGSIWSCSMGSSASAFAPVSAFGAVGLFFGLVLRRRKRNTKNS
jgi:hypothetical protein